MSWITRCYGVFGAQVRSPSAFDAQVNVARHGWISASTSFTFSGSAGLFEFAPSTWLNVSSTIAQ
jgi:hypothetical protein